MLVAVASSIVVLYAFYLFACGLIEYLRKRDAQIQLSHVGDRVSEATRRKYAEAEEPPLPSFRAVLKDPRFRRGGIAS
jgi:hypothetical protein